LWELPEFSEGVFSLFFAIAGIIVIVISGIIGAIGGSIGGAVYSKMAE
jgi:hypothetical protein